MEEYFASLWLEKVQMELRTYPRSMHHRVTASKSALFSSFSMAFTWLDVKVKSMKG